MLQKNIKIYTQKLNIKVKKMYFNWVVFVKNYYKNASINLKRSYIMGLSIMAVGISIAYGLGSPSSLCKLKADSDLFTYEYCYTTNVYINNSGSNTLNNYPVRLTIPYQAWFNNNKIDTYANNYLPNANLWDLRAFSQTYSNQVEFIGQDIHNTTKPNPVFYSIMPTLAPGDTQLQILTGNNEAKRSNFIYFYNGNDTFTTLDNNNLDLTDNYKIEATVRTFNQSVLSNAGAIVSKYDQANSQGYKITLETNTNNASGFDIKCTSDNYSAVIPLPVTNEKIYITFENTFTKFECGASYGNNAPVLSTNYIANTSTANTNNLISGQLLRQVGLYELGIIDLTNNVYKANYLFNAKELTENDSVCPFVTGVTDFGPNNLTGSWTLTECGNNITYNISTTEQTTESIAPDVPSNLASNWVGGFYGDQNPYIKNTENNQAIGFEFFETPQNLGVPANLWYSIIFIGLAIIIMVPVFITSQSILITLLVGSMPLMFAVSIGVLPVFFVIIWFLLTLGTVGVKQYAEGF
ncbi:MAG: hypothetical protein CMM83_04245 [Rhodospirillales bacterium]|nr:hypothetical protein [Rhodospirillales bacterium]|tara:strand:- start:928 stop:2496 length:1569 start_codon:yes stop_codon:yes gene_type:complete